MRVGVRRHGVNGAAKIVDGFVDPAHFFEDAAEIVAANRIAGIERKRREKRLLGFIELAEMIERHAKIDVRLDPIGGDIEDALIRFDRFVEHLRITFCGNRDFEPFLGGARFELVELLRRLTPLQRQNPLARQGIKRRRAGPGRNHGNAAPAFDELQILDAQRRLSELAFDGGYGAAQSASWHAGIREAFDDAQGGQIAEIVEMLAPANTRTDEAQTFPVAQPAIVDTYNSPSFHARIAIAQSTPGRGA